MRIHSKFKNIALILLNFLFIDSVCAQMVYNRNKADTLDQNLNTIHKKLIIQSIFNEILAKKLIDLREWPSLYYILWGFNIEEIKPNYTIASNVGIGSSCTFYYLKYNDSAVVFYNRSDSIQYYLSDYIDIETFFKLKKNEFTVAIITDDWQHKLYRIKGFDETEAPRFNRAFYHYFEIEVRSRRKLLRSYRKGKLLDELGVI
jgi:hypothetical protein